MGRKTQRTEGLGGVEIIEETTHLLRNIPVKALVTYYVGSIPFVLAFLYFWADMSRSSLAAQRNMESAFVLSFFFIWMKCWQTVFAQQLWTIVSGEEGAPWTFSRISNMIAEQTAIQPTGFIILPVTLIITLPFGWTYSFYQSITLLGSGKGEGLKSLFKKGMRHAAFFPKQNHIALMILALFWFFVFFNLVTLLYLAPRMINTFFGVETVFSRAGWTIFNTTFLAVAWSTTYLIVDPLIKGVYVLRSFYGESLRTGADLMCELKRIIAAATKGSTVLLIVFIICVGGGFGKGAFAERPPSTKRAVSAGELADSIDDVIKKREYQWRMPRVKEKNEKKTEGFLFSFLRGSAKTIKDWLRPFKNWIKKGLKWLDEILKHIPSRDRHQKEDKNFGFSVHYLIYALLCLVSSVLAIMGWRKFKQLKLPDLAGTEMNRPLAPDLASEEISADQLPVNGWLELGRQLMKEGNHRLALRAFYLAGLAHLSEQNRISIASFKSNREYENELRRRAHAVPELVRAFSLNRLTFERIWYGMHEITTDLVKNFEANQEKIMAYHEK